MIGATKGVLHYVFKREIVILANNDNFELEICVKARGGRTAHCMGDVPVADLQASKARHPSHGGPRGHVRSAADDPSNILSGTINRGVMRDLTTPSNYQKHPEKKTSNLVRVKNYTRTISGGRL